MENIDRKAFWEGYLSKEAGFGEKIQRMMPSNLTGSKATDAATQIGSAALRYGNSGPASKAAGAGATAGRMLSKDFPTGPAQMPAPSTPPLPPGPTHEKERTMDHSMPGKAPSSNPFAAAPQAALAPAMTAYTGRANPQAAQALPRELTSLSMADSIKKALGGGSSVTGASAGGVAGVAAGGYQPPPRNPIGGSNVGTAGVGGKGASGFTSPAATPAVNFSRQSPFDRNQGPRESVPTNYKKLAEMRKKGLIRENPVLERYRRTGKWN
jgi:hypothetical protein